MDHIAEGATGVGERAGCNTLTVSTEHLDHLTALSALQALHFACPSDLRHQLSDSALSRLEPLATSLTSLSLTCRSLPPLLIPRPTLSLSCVL